jgi:hypothetical protein
MYDLPIDTATIKKIKGHQYYIFPKPGTHTNQKDRPQTYANPKLLQTYKGVGSNNSAKLLPDVFDAANTLMSALIQYGKEIDDWSMQSAVIQNGYRPDDASQGKEYLRIIKKVITEHPDTFGTIEFPSDLEDEAQSVLGKPGDKRRVAFHTHLAAATAAGWNSKLAAILFNLVDRRYAPRGFNPHSTGFVFDLDFSIFDGSGERNVGAEPKLNDRALQCAVGNWLNKYAMDFGFDSYDTDAEVWHQELRSP